MPLAAELDLLPVGDAGGDAHGDRLAVGGLQRDLVALGGGDEVERRRRRDIPALRGPAEAAIAARRLAEPAAAEEAAEQVVVVAALLERVRLAACRAGRTSLPKTSSKPAATTGAARRGESRTRAHGADGVVLLALLGVGEHRVRLADLLELRLRGGVTGIRVGVVLARELAVDLLQLRVAHVLGDAEHLVEVLVEPILTGHRHLLPRNLVCCGSRSAESRRVSRPSGRVSRRASRSSTRRGCYSGVFTTTLAARSSVPPSV